MHINGKDDAFEKIDPRRLKDKTASKNYCYTNKCKDFRKLMKLAWKVKGCLKSKTGAGDGSYHTACAARHLEKHCNEAGRISIQQRLIEKKKN